MRRARSDRDGGIRTPSMNSSLALRRYPSGPRISFVSSQNARLRLFKRTSSGRSEEHTSELQSRFDLVCRLLLEKKNKKAVDGKREHVRHQDAVKRSH